MAKIDVNLNLNVNGADDAGDLDNTVEDLNRDLIAAQSSAKKAWQEVKKLKEQIEELGGNEKSTQKIVDAISGLGSAMANVPNTTQRAITGMKNFVTSTKDVQKAYADAVKQGAKTETAAVKMLDRVSEKLDYAKEQSSQMAKQMSRDFRLANSLLVNMSSMGGGNLTERQEGLLERQLTNFERGKINTAVFAKRAMAISKEYGKEFNRRLELSSVSKDGLEVIKEQNRQEERMARIANNRLESEAKAQTTIEKTNIKREESNARLEREAALNRERLKQEDAKLRRQEELAAAAESLSRGQEAKAKKQESQQRVQAKKEQEYYDNLDAAETARQQKIEKNERARMILQEQMQSMVEDTYQLESREAQRLAMSLSRLSDTVINVRNFAETEGRKGTVGAQATSFLRTSQFYKNINDYAVAWKQVNSAEGEAADNLERMAKDLKSLQHSVNGVHTAFGQLASAVSAVRGISVQLRKTLVAIAEPVLNVVRNITSQAFRSSLEALKDLELAQIGFSNFYGQSAVSGIVGNIKQEALLSPLSAAQLAGYVGQVAPLSKGNSQLAIDAVMGVAKMIQYSGGEVSTEMEYVIKNLRDVVSKGKALTIDIRQFNRAMPALTKVLQEMGETDLLRNGELTIDEKSAPKLLEAFQKVGKYGDVSTIFESTSQTVSGLIERVEEQIQFMIIDIGEFSGLTDLLKKTISDLLDDTDGKIRDLKMTLQFIGRDVASWLKSRDWERALNTAKEIVKVLWDGLKDSLGVLKSSLGGSDWRGTLKNLAQLIADFVRGIANSYSWLLGIMNTLQKSGILGSGLLQVGSKVAGFLSGNAGTFITGLLRGFGNILGFLEKQMTLLISEIGKTQATYMTSAKTLASFDEALLIAARTMDGFSKSLLEIDSILGGVLTSEQREVIANEMAASSEDRETIANELARKSEERETAAREANIVATEAEKRAKMSNAASTAMEGTSKTANWMLNLLGAKGATTGVKGVIARLLGQDSVKSGGTLLAEKLNEGFKAGLKGAMISMISQLVTGGIADLAGADKYGKQNAQNIVGSVGGGVAMGAGIGSLFPGFGNIIGAVLGGIGGAVKAGLQSSGIVDQGRQDELEAFKATVNNGEYLKSLLSNIEHGNDITSEQFDNLRSIMTKQMNQWSASMPNGTAQMLKDYLSHIEYNGRDISDTVKTIAQDDDLKAETLWDFVKRDEVDKGNEYAATLQSLGWSNHKIAAAIFGKAIEHGESTDSALNFLLKWGSVQDNDTADLSLDEVRGLSGSDYELMKSKLEASWINIGMEAVQNLDLEEADKVAFSKKFANAMIDLMMNGIEAIDDEEMAYLTRFFNAGGIESGEKLGLLMSPLYMAGLTAFGENAEALRKKLGIDLNNIDFWSSSYMGRASEDENGNPLGSSTFYAPQEVIDAIAPKLLTIEGKFKWIEDHYKEFGLSTKQLVESWKNSFKSDIKETMSSQETLLEQIKGNTDTLVERSSSSNGLAPFINNLLNEDGTLKTKNKANGGIVHLASGGSPRGVDTIPAMLQRGEYVVRKSAVDKIGLSALNALNTGNTGYFTRAMERQNIYGDYSNARTWNNNSYDNRRSTRNYVKVINNSKGARLNRYYSLANRLA